MNRPTDKHPADEASDIALRTGLRADGLSAEALQRIRRATEAEWRNTLVAAPRRRWLPMAAAASVALMLVGALGVYSLNNQGAAGALVGLVDRADAPGLELEQGWRSDIALTAGAEIRVSNNLLARGDTLVKLTQGGNLRLARGSEISVSDSDTVRLVRGELYVDMPPGSSSPDFRVTTPDGEFRHVGTQFSVALLDGRTRLRVREGSVRWSTASDEQQVMAGNELTVGGGERNTRPITTAGRDWSWAESLVPDFDIEGRALGEFLEWFARETGRKLEIADEATRSRVAEIRMHGNVRGLTLLEALSAVMSTTSLQYELPDDAIRVSSGRAAAPTT
jgi:ferric-dicitrate binding protein FerR (iron transport regulator)